LSFIIRFILFSLWRSSLRAGAAGTTTNDAWLLITECSAWLIVR
jgi:hypothetical protein